MIIGIDPGFTGAMAFLYSDKLLIEDLPVKKIKNKRQIDEKLFVSLVEKHICGVEYAVIEDIGAMPGQGISSTSRFTYNAGILLGVLAALKIPTYKVLPSVWKPALGLSRCKKSSLALAKKLFIDNKDDFRLIKHDGRAEAALIAYFARESLGITTNRAA
jgi:crossover junction endodeoxyribonuclease RuvC